MRTFLRRLGIIIFVTLSLLVWAGDANRLHESEFAMGIDFRALLLGSSLACLAVLIISEIADWGRSLLEATRQETFLAAWPVADLGYVQHSQDESVLDEKMAWPAATREIEAVRLDREWVDVRHPVEADGLG